MRSSEGRGSSTTTSSTMLSTTSAHPNANATARASGPRVARCRANVVPSASAYATTTKKPTPSNRAISSTLCTANAAPPQPTVTATLTLSLEAVSDIERKTVVYQCDNGDGFRVQYVNAAPNFLAILPVEGETHIFATALSASGARYVSGPFEWWSQGDEATLRDLRTEEDEPPLATCLAAGDAP